MLKEICAVMAAFSITGCGGGSDGGSASTPLPPTTPTTPTTPSGGPTSLATGLQIPWSIAF